LFFPYDKDTIGEGVFTNPEKAGFFNSENAVNKEVINYKILLFRGFLRTFPTVKKN